jgi:hypothetical protein
MLNSELISGTFDEGFTRGSAWMHDGMIFQEYAQNVGEAVGIALREEFADGVPETAYELAVNEAVHDLVMQEPPLSGYSAAFFALGVAKSAYKHKKQEVTA